MPRNNSTNWSTGDNISATRLQQINADLDNLYSEGSDRLKVYASTGLDIIIGAGVYKVWSNEWQYAGGTETVTDDETNYIMIDNAGVIQQSIVTWNADYAKLAVVIAAWWVITSVVWWRNDIIGWPSWETDKTIFAHTAGEDITQWEAVYVSDGSGWRTSGRVYKASADTSTYADASEFEGFATQTITTGNSIKISNSGNDSNQSWLTVGADYFLTNTAGTIWLTPWKNIVQVWRAISATVIHIACNIQKIDKTKYLSWVGEAVTQGDCLAIHKMWLAADATTLNWIGDAAAQTKVAFCVIGNGISTSSLIAIMRKQNTPADNCVVRIETDNSNAPSGTLADANATVTVAWTVFNTVAANYTFTFPWSFTLTDKTKYWVVFSRSGAIDATNRFQVSSADLGNSSIFHWSKWDGSVWTADTTKNLYFQNLWAYRKAIWKSNSSWKQRFCWFADYTAAAYANIEFTTSGIFNKLSWLNEGDPYFMASAVSWTIGTLAWSWTAFRLWIALSATELFIWPQLSSYSI